MEEFSMKKSFKRVVAATIAVAAMAIM